MAIKISLGKLEVLFSVPEWEKLLKTEGFSILPLAFNHFELLLTLPFHHNDPFDRLLIAQALGENMSVITHDSRFKSYAVSIELF